MIADTKIQVDNEEALHLDTCLWRLQRFFCRYKRYDKMSRGGVNS